MVYRSIAAAIRGPALAIVPAATAVAGALAVPELHLYGRLLPDGDKLEHQAVAKAIDFRAEVLVGHFVAEFEGVYHHFEAQSNSAMA